MLSDHPDPFLRHQVDPTQVQGVWHHGEATAVAALGHLPAGTGTVLTVVGPTTDVGRLTASLVEEVTPWRVTVPIEAAEAVPDAWRSSERWYWHWMLTTTPPPAPDLAIEEVADAAEINAVLDAGQPTAHARPGSSGIECWLGVRRSGALLAVGALVRQSDGTGHLRAVTVLPEARGEGFGRDLSAALTRRALATGSGVATLGVYTDNDAAIAIYRRLGYAVVHTFASGPVS